MHGASCPDSVYIAEIPVLSKSRRVQQRVPEYENMKVCQSMRIEQKEYGRVYMVTNCYLFEMGHSSCSISECDQVHVY